MFGPRPAALPSRRARDCCKTTRAVRTSVLACNACETSAVSMGSSNLAHHCASNEPESHARGSVVTADHREGTGASRPFEAVVGGCAAQPPKATATSHSAGERQATDKPVEKGSKFLRVIQCPCEIVSHVDCGHDPYPAYCDRLNLVKLLQVVGLNNNRDNAATPPVGLLLGAQRFMRFGTKPNPDIRGIFQ